MAFKKGRAKTGGRKKGTKNKYSLEEFMRTLAKAERTEKKKLYEVIIQKALSGDRFFVNLVVSRMLPELKHIDVNGDFSTSDVTDEKLEEIRQELIKRFNATQPKE